MQLTDSERALIEKLREVEEADFMLSIMRLAQPKGPPVWIVTFGQPMVEGIAPRQAMASEFDVAWSTVLATQATKLLPQ
jgi:hypothetical protein